MSPTLSTRIVGDRYERFTEEAATSMIGQSFLAKEGEWPKWPKGIGIVRSANLVDEGRAIEIEIEWPESWNPSTVN